MKVLIEQKLKLLALSLHMARIGDKETLLLLHEVAADLSRLERIMSILEEFGEEE